MYILNEKDKAYRHTDHGPKYLMKGPRMNFGLILLNPGDDADAHYHVIMEENFYVLEGQLTIYVDGKEHILNQGDFIHIEPEERHYLKNNGSVPCRFCMCLAPFQMEDKVCVEFTPEG